MSEANEDTGPASISGLRKVVEKNARVSAASLEWSVKTYNMVKPVVDGMAAAQAQSRAAARESRYAMIVASFALLLSCAGLACSVLQ